MARRPPEILDRDPSKHSFDRHLLMRLGQLPETTGGSAKIALDWFSHQTDRVGDAIRLEVARRRDLEAD